MRFSDYIALTEADASIEDLIKGARSEELANRTIQSVVNQGQLTADELAALQRKYPFLSAVTMPQPKTKQPGTAFGGTAVPKPQKGSWQSEEKKRRMKYSDPGGFADVKEYMVKYISIGKEYSDQIRDVIMNEKMRRKEAASAEASPDLVPRAARRKAGKS